MIDIYLRDNHEKYSKKEKEEQEKKKLKKESEVKDELVLLKRKSYSKNF